MKPTFLISRFPFVHVRNHVPNLNAKTFNRQWPRTPASSIIGSWRLLLASRDGVRELRGTDEQPTMSRDGTSEAWKPPRSKSAKWHNDRETLGSPRSLRNGFTNITSKMFAHSESIGFGMLHASKVATMNGLSMSLLTASPLPPPATSTPHHRP